MTVHRATFGVLLLVSGSVALATASQLTQVSSAQLRERLDAFVPAAMARLGVVPGLTMSVVRGGDVIYTAGFGQADVERTLPATPDTVFYTASLAKAFTGMTAAVLVSQGRLDPDAPIATFFPGFVPPAGADPTKVTVRGLLAHDPGFGNSTVNYLTTFVRPFESDAALVRVLNTYSQPLERFTYANTNYALVAMIIEKATKRPWRDVMEEFVIRPLGMTKTTAYVSRAPDVARPYAAESEGFVLMPLPKTDRTITGAGGIFSTAPDLARFVEACLNEGRVDGRQALPAAAVRLAQTAIANLEATFTYFRRTGYGMGQYVADYDGEPMFHHFGSITGYRSHLSYLPQRGLGVVVLGNEGADGSRFADLIAGYAYDVLLGKDADARASSRIDEYRTGLSRARAQRAGPRAEWRARWDAPGTPAMPLASYAGRYRSERLGDLDVEVAGPRLTIAFGDLGGDAVPVADHEFLVSWRDAGQPERWRFSAVDGVVAGFDWGGRAFVRVAR